MRSLRVILNADVAQQKNIDRSTFRDVVGVGEKN
jgi:hypothetical protein